MVKDGKWATVMLKLNRNTLDTIFSRTYKHSWYDFALSNFIKVRENKYILWGTKGWGQTSSWPFALVLDSNLAVQSTQQLQANYFHAKCAVWNPIQKKIVLAGRLPKQKPFDNIVLQEVDTLGIVTNSCISNSSYSLFAANIYFSASDSSYVLPGVQITADLSSGFYKFKPNLSKYGQNLNLRWRKSYGPESKVSDFGAATILADGSIVASGMCDYVNTDDPSGLILKVNPKGVAQFVRVYDHHSGVWITEYFRGLTITPDKGIVTVGESGAYSSRKAWIIKTDSSGCLQPNCLSYSVSVDSLLLDPPPPATITTLSDFESSEAACRLYPNPFTSGFTLKISSKEESQFDVSVCDMSGRSFVISQTHDGECYLGETLTSGVYLLTARAADSGTIYRKIIVKQ